MIYFIMLCISIALILLTSQINSIKKEMMSKVNELRTLFNKELSAAPGLSMPNWSHRSGCGWTIGDYQQALNSLRKQTEEMAVRLEDLEKKVTEPKLCRIYDIRNK